MVHEPEEIPSDPEHELYKWVSRTKIKGDSVDINVFADLRGGMSASWSKHISAEGCLHLPGVLDPEKKAVIALPVGEVRALELEGGARLEVVHTPKAWNCAHSDVKGDKRDPEVRAKLARIAERAGIRVRPKPQKPNKDGSQSW